MSDPTLQPEADSTHQSESQGSPQQSFVHRHSCMTREQFDAIQWFNYKLESTYTHRQPEGDTPMSCYKDCTDKDGNKYPSIAVYDGPRAQKFVDGYNRWIAAMAECRKKLKNESSSTEKHLE